MKQEIDPKLDLVIERTVSAPPEVVWAAWTKPEHVKRWFTPAPWVTAECVIDLRPGGQFLTAMQSPDGKEKSLNNACYLDVVPNERLVWTIALEPGFRPTNTVIVPLEHVAANVPLFTAIVTLEPSGKGTRYKVVAKHRDEAGAKQHLEMGFHEGWGQCTDQLVALVEAQVKR
jgi:uncharacterized protein YndB with AHSA1/START domain